MSDQGSSTYIYCLGHDIHSSNTKKCDDHISRAPDFHNFTNIKVPLKCDRNSHTTIEILTLTTLINIFKGTQSIKEHHIKCTSRSYSRNANNLVSARAPLSDRTDYKSTLLHAIVHANFYEILPQIAQVSW